MITVERIKILLFNALVYLNTESMDPMTMDETTNFLKEEIGFTDEELKELNVLEEVYKVD